MYIGIVNGKSVRIVILKVGRSLYVAITLVVVCSLFLAGLARWQGSGAAEEGRGSAEYTQHIPFKPVCYAVGAVGVILLGWYWLRLSGAITSIVELARIGQARGIGVPAKSTSRPITDRISGDTPEM